MIDLDALNTACCESLADKVRSDLRLLETLGIADNPAMTYVDDARAFLTRYDAAGLDAAMSSSPRAGHLRSVS